ncbi:MAG: GNAT family N-acetyltransferase, partial [Alphaproteobacteria bacterium]
MTSNNFALTTLAQNPEYFEEVIGLIEEGFHYNESFHYEKDFAPLVDPLNFENCFLYIDKETNTVAAHLAVCIRTLVKDEIETQVALVGGIVTSKKHRGKKLFGNLMNHALSTYENKVSLYILWSDLEVIYEKFFFYRTGGIIETGKGNLSSSEKPAGYGKTKFASLTEKDFDRVRFLYQTFNEKYFFTLKRGERDWAIIKDMNSIDLYIKKNHLGEIIKYFCINKGRDLTN